MSSGSTIQRDDGGWRLPIEHRCVGRCVIDHAFALEFYDGADSMVVRIECDFTIIERGLAHRFTPSEPRGLGPAVALFGQVVSSAWALVDGTLAVTFEDGRVMSVAPDTGYEAWEFFGPGGMRAVCAPGGTVSVWQPKYPGP